MDGLSRDEIVKYVEELAKSFLVKDSISDFMKIPDIMGIYGRVKNDPKWFVAENVVGYAAYNLNKLRSVRKASILLDRESREKIEALYDESKSMIVENTIKAVKLMLSGDANPKELVEILGEIALTSTKISDFLSYEEPSKILNMVEEE